MNRAFNMFQIKSAADFRSEQIVKSGRAVIVPEYKGTFGGRDGYVSDTPDMTTQYRDRMIVWAKDMMRSLDYLETRSEIDMSKLSYVGGSLGARMGPIMTAVEPRFKVNVWALGGLKMQRTLPEVDSLHFAPRVKIPTPMMNGRFDFTYPLEMQLGLFRLLGTPTGDKRHIVCESSH